jgi:hypothetical protein
MEREASMTGPAVEKRRTVSSALSEQDEVIALIRDVRQDILEALGTVGPPAAVDDTPEPSNHVVALRKRVEEHTAQLQYHQEVLGQILEVVRGL